MSVGAKFYKNLNKWSKFLKCFPTLDSRYPKSNHNLKFGYDNMTCHVCRINVETY